MKTLILFSLFSLFSNFTLMTCSTDPTEVETPVDTSPPCIPRDIPFTTMESYFGCQNTKNTMNINLKNTHTIIRSQSQFNQLVTNSTNCDVNLDISNYDLVIGKKQLTSGNQTIEYQYIDDCKTKKLKVTFIQDQTLVAPNITYHALIPKLAEGETLVVETIVN